MQLMQSPYKERYHHLHRVLYKKHNRVIVLSIPIELTSSSAIQYNLPEGDGNSEERVVVQSKNEK